MQKQTLDHKIEEQKSKNRAWNLHVLQKG